MSFPNGDKSSTELKVPVLYFQVQFKNAILELFGLVEQSRPNMLTPPPYSAELDRNLHRPMTIWLSW